MILTNDDGIDAPGLSALEQAAARFGGLIVAAPDRCHSSMSHHVNTADPIQVTELTPARFRIEASPADCARLAFACLAPNARYLLSGINRGGNLGMDTHYSGTVAAAREAAILGFPAIAISQYISREYPLDWSQSTLLALSALEHLLPLTLAKGEFWNVNLPHLAPNSPPPPVLYVPLDPSPLPVTYRQEDTHYRYTGRYPDRQRLPGHDVALCFAGHITATLLTTSGTRPSPDNAMPVDGR